MPAARFPLQTGARTLGEQVVVLAVVLAAELGVGGMLGTASPVYPGYSGMLDNTASLALVDASERSLNWSGYVAKGGGFTSVSGSWTVPGVSHRGASVAADATWVGIGGVQNKNLLQAGTQAIVDPTGSVQYEAWIEALPGKSTQVPLAVSAGDTIRTSLTETSPDRWLVTIQNATTGRTYTATIPYASQHASAEWIEEMPSADVFIPLDDFGSVHFTAAQAVQNGVPITPKQAGARPLTLVSADGNTLAVPSVLAESGGAFRIARDDAPVVAQQKRFLEDMARPAR